MTERIEFHNPPTLTRAVGYAHGAETRGGRLLFVAGQVAKDTEGRVVGSGDLVAQFRQGCENLRAVVAAAGGELTDVGKLTIYVLDTDLYKQHGKAIGGGDRGEFGRQLPPVT